MSRRRKPEDVAKEFIRRQEDQEGFEVKYIDSFIGSHGFLQLLKNFVNTFTLASVSEYKRNHLSTRIVTCLYLSTPANLQNRSYSSIVVKLFNV